MNNTIIFTAELWLHSHAETGDPCEYEVFSVSGYQLPVDLILDMHNHGGDWVWLMRSGVPMEKVVRVQAEAWYDDGDSGEGGYPGYWDLTCLAWMDITPPAILEEYVS